MARAGFDMLSLCIGDVWVFPTGKRVEIVDRAFIWGGRRLVLVYDFDFPQDDPRVFDVERFADASREKEQR